MHGRGGQGVVTAAELLSVAAFDEGRHAQAFPSFGSERMGAPVVSFCRIDEHPIRRREPVSEPDALIIQDATLLHQVAVFDGLRPDGSVLINSTRSLDELGLEPLLDRLSADRVTTVPATDLAREELGRPMPGAPLLGAFAALSGEITLDAVCRALRERFNERVAEGNVRAATRAFALVSPEHAHA